MLISESTVEHFFCEYLSLKFFLSFLSFEVYPLFCHCLTFTRKSSFLKLASGLIIIFSSFVYSAYLLLLLTYSRLYVLLSGLTFRMRLLCLVLPLLLSIESATADSKAITTTLTTKWANTPLLLEARYVTSPL